MIKFTEHFLFLKIRRFISSVFNCYGEDIVNHLKMIETKQDRILNMLDEHEKIVTRMLSVTDRNAKQLAVIDETIEIKLFQFNNKIHCLSQAIVDPQQLSLFKLRCEVLGVPKHYEFRLVSLMPGDIVIDGGANIGLFTDLALSFGASVVAFEPNPILVEFLKKKYKSNQRVDIINQAVWVEDRILNLSIGVDSACAYTDAAMGGSIIKNNKFIETCPAEIAYNVQALDFVDYIQKLYIKNNKKIKFIKLDIEGAEFEVINRILDTGAYDCFECMVCETHERYFENGSEILTKLKERLKNLKIKHIFLDWV